MKAESVVQTQFPFQWWPQKGPAMFALGVVFEDASLRSNQQWVEWISEIGRAHV